MVTPSVTPAASTSLPFDHELACEHGVIGWLECQSCNSIMDARLFGCQIYGRHAYRVSDYDMDGGEVLTCTYCEWEVSVRHGD